MIYENLSNYCNILSNLSKFYENLSNYYYVLSKFMRFYLSFIKIHRIIIMFYQSLSKFYLSFRKVEHSDSDRAQFFIISVFVNNLLSPPPPSFPDLVLISTFIVLSECPIKFISKILS